MMPDAMPNVLCSTWTTGARQLVVQLAFESTLCFAGSYFASFTPSTSVMSSLVAGAEMMTFFTVVPRCVFALVPSVKNPVDSTTISAPTEAQSSFAGSRSAKTLIVFPSTMSESSVEEISCFRFPRIESYFSRCASVAGVVRSFTATNSISGLPSAVRKTLRPMRPKPLMPTLTAMCTSSSEIAVCTVPSEAIKWFLPAQCVCGLTGRVLQASLAVAVRSTRAATTSGAPVPGTKRDSARCAIGYANR